MRTFSILGVACLLLSGASVARADRVDREEMRRYIRHLEEKSEEFTRAFRRAIDGSRLDGSSIEDRLNKQVKELEKAIESLRRQSERRRDLWDLRDEVREVVDEGAEVNRIMIRLELHRRVEREWVSLRDAINALARSYRIGGIPTGPTRGGFFGR